jgi:hypothetical protein
VGKSDACARALLDRLPVHLAIKLVRERVDELKAKPALARWTHATPIVLNRKACFTEFGLGREADPDRPAGLVEGVLERVGDPFPYKPRQNWKYRNALTFDI